MGTVKIWSCLVLAVLLHNVAPTVGDEECLPETIPGKTMYTILNYETETCLGTMAGGAETPPTILTMKICDNANEDLHFYFEPQNKIKHLKSGLCFTAVSDKLWNEAASIGSSVLLLPCEPAGKLLSGFQTWFEHDRYNSFTAMWTTWKADSGDLRMTANKTWVPYTPFMSFYDYSEGQQLWIFKGVPTCENPSPGDIP